MGCGLYVFARKVSLTSCIDQMGFGRFGPRGNADGNIALDVSKFCYNLLHIYLHIHIYIYVCTYAHTYMHIHLYIMLYNDRRIAIFTSTLSYAACGSNLKPAARS